MPSAFANYFGEIVTIVNKRLIMSYASVCMPLCVVRDPEKEIAFVNWARAQCTIVRTTILSEARKQRSGRTSSKRNNKNEIAEARMKEIRYFREWKTRMWILTRLCYVWTDRMAHDAWPKCVHKLSANVESNRISRLSFLFKEDAKEMKKETHKISLNKSIMCEYWIEWRRQTSTSTLMGLDTAPHRNQWATNNSLSSIS